VRSIDCVPPVEFLRLRMGSRTPWTEEELRQLEHLAAQSVSLQVIALKLGRSTAAVDAKAAHLKIGMKRMKRRYRRRGTGAAGSAADRDEAADRTQTPASGSILDSASITAGSKRVRSRHRLCPGVLETSGSSVPNRRAPASLKCGANTIDRKTPGACDSGLLEQKKSSR